MKESSTGRTALDALSVVVIYGVAWTAVVVSVWMMYVAVFG